MQGVCTDVSVEREKSILKQDAIQHLYGRLSGKLREGFNDASLLVKDLLFNYNLAAGLDTTLFCHMRMQADLHTCRVFICLDIGIY